MIRIYTTPSCASSRKAKKWLEEHNVEYKEISLFNNQITNEDLNLILKNAPNGVDDIISSRSKIIREGNININDMTLSELKAFIIEHPSVLRRPIIVGDDRMQVGYNEDDIRIFIPKRLRELIMCASCESEEDCDYKKAVKQYLEEVRKQLREEK